MEEKKICWRGKRRADKRCRCKRRSMNVDGAWNVPTRNVFCSFSLPFPSLYIYTARQSSVLLFFSLSLLHSLLIQLKCIFFLYNTIYNSSKSNVILIQCQSPTQQSQLAIRTAALSIEYKNLFNSRVHYGRYIFIVLWSDIARWISALNRGLQKEEKMNNNKK